MKVYNLLTRRICGQNLRDFQEFQGTIGCKCFQIVNRSAIECPNTESCSCENCVSWKLPGNGSIAYIVCWSGEVERIRSVV